LSVEEAGLHRADSMKDALRLDTATALYQELEKIFLAENNWEKVISCRRNAAWCRWYDHDSETAKGILDAALPLAAEKLGAGHLEVARLHIIRGNIYADQRTGGTMRQALEEFEQANGVFRQHYGNRDPALAEIYDRFAIAYFLADDYSRGILYADSALALLDTLNPANTQICCRLYNTLGVNYTGLGRFDRVLVCFQKARRLWRSTHPAEDSQIVNYLESIGRAQLGLGDAYAAESTYEEARALVERVGEQHGKLLAFAREGLGDCRLAQGDTAAAASIYQACLDQFWPVNTPDNLHGRSLLLCKIGRCQLALDQPQAAVGSFTEVMDLAEKRHLEADNFNLVEPLLGLGDALRQAGQGRQALKCWRRALEVALPVTGLRHPVIGQARFRIARYYLHAGYLNQAMQWAEQARDASLLPGVSKLETHRPAFAEIGQPEVYLALLKLMGQIHTQRYWRSPTNFNCLDAALTCYRQAIFYADTLQSTLFTDEARLDLQAQVASVAENALAGIYQKWTLSRRDELLDTAFLFIEKSKSALLAADLRESAARSANVLPSD
ncbi:MAG: tetratricopeptide repeat protein, partial [Saprospiraceae bacterium]